MGGARSTRRGDIDQGNLLSLLERSIAFATPITSAMERDPKLREFNESLVAPVLDASGCTIEFDELGSCVGYLPGEGQPVMFVTYAMTHGAGTMETPWTPVQENHGGKLWVKGRAACEQRGGFAAALTAVEHAGAARQRRPVIFVSLASGETGRHTAIEKVVKALSVRPQFAILALCTDNGIVTAHKGRADIHLVAQGCAAHSSSPQLGINAAEAMVRAVARLVDQRWDGEHPLLGTRSTAVLELSSESDGNHTVPRRCRSRLDVRLLPGDDPKGAVSFVQSVLEGTDIGIELGDWMLPAEADPSSDVVRSLTEAYRAATGRDPQVRWFAASTDMGYLNQVELPSVCFGPGAETRAHTNDDRVEFDQVCSAAETYAHLILSSPSD